MRDAADMAQMAEASSTVVADVSAPPAAAARAAPTPEVDLKAAEDAAASLFAGIGESGDETDEDDEDDEGGLGDVQSADPASRVGASSQEDDEPDWLRQASSIFVSPTAVTPAAATTPHPASTASRVDRGASRVSFATPVESVVTTPTPPPQPATPHNPPQPAVTPTTAPSSEPPPQAGPSSSTTPLGATSAAAPPPALRMRGSCLLRVQLLSAELIRGRQEYMVYKLQVASHPELPELYRRFSSFLKLLE